MLALVSKTGAWLQSWWESLTREHLATDVYGHDLMERREAKSEGESCNRYFTTDSTPPSRELELDSPQRGGVFSRGEFCAVYGLSRHGCLNV